MTAEMRDLPSRSMQTVRAAYDCALRWYARSSGLSGQARALYDGVYGRGAPRWAILKRRRVGAVPVDRFRPAVAGVGNHCAGWLRRVFGLT
jgi:hypothetical protein